MVTHVLKNSRYIFTKVRKKLNIRMFCTCKKQQLLYVTISNFSSIYYILRQFLHFH